MRPEFEKYSAIDDYLGGKLSAQENAAFEKSMAEDPALREDVFDRKVVNEIIIEKRFFDIAGGFSGASSTGVSSLVSKTVLRFVGIGAALTVILFTPYYFSKKAEPAIEKSASPEQKTEEVNVVAPIVVEENPTVLEEQVQETTAVVSSEEIANEPVKVQEKNTVVASKKKENRKKKSSYILEIPIDDPSTKGHHSNSFSFNASKGQNWTIPAKKNADASIKIFSKDGDEVYSTILEKDKKHTWNGVANDGSKQKAGKYVYVLDFGKGDIQHGHVTIIR